MSKTITITGEIRLDTETDGVTDNKAKARDVNLYISYNGLEFAMPYEKFSELLHKSKQNMTPTIDDPGISDIGIKELDTKTNSGTDYGALLISIVKLVNMKDTDFEDDEECNIYVTSSSHEFIELPWEEITSNEVIVIREVLDVEEQPTIYNNSSVNNITILSSYAHRDKRGDLAHLGECIDGEVNNIFSLCREHNSTKFMFNRVDTLKHTTLNNLTNYNFLQYKYVHIVMHGDNNGGLLLARNDSDQYKYIQSMTRQEIVGLLEGDKFELIFFSTCYSGGEVQDAGEKESIAVQIIKKGISKYTIGYRGGAGNTSSMNNALSFYSNLRNDGDVLLAYKNALKKLYGAFPKGDKLTYVPYLYKSAQK